MGAIREGMAMARGAMLGSVTMYLLDPVAGRRRRAVLRDKAVRGLYEAEDFMEGAVEDLRNRARGLAAETISAVRNEPVPDSALHDRIRALMGRIVSHPRTIHVTVNGGRITLSGPIFSDEAPRLIDAVAGVRGVQGVENLLESHSALTEHPALQGGAVAREPLPEYLQTYWTDGPRLIACLAGCGLAMRGARTGGILGTVLGLTGLALMAEAGARTPKARKRVPTTPPVHKAGQIDRDVPVTEEISEQARMEAA